MIKNFLLAALLATAAFEILPAQKEANTWIFGELGGAIDFNCSPPEPFVRSQESYLEGIASISDSSGQFLFYSDGINIFDRSFHIMPNGAGIGVNPDCGNSTTQAALILPLPGSPGIYYVFTTDCAEQDLLKGFRYSVVDMSLNGGMGDVTVRSQQIMGPVCEKLAAVNHQNGTDVWVMVHEHGTDAFYAWLLTAAGLSPTPVVSNTGFTQILPTYPTCMARGYMKFSPDGQKLVVNSGSDCHSYVFPTQIFNFDDSTGQVELAFTLGDPDSLMYYGASFSPDGQRLYLTQGWWNSRLFQYDLSVPDSAAIVNSRTLLFEDPTYSLYPMALQLGTDGLLYVSMRSSNYLGVVQYPNALGQAVSFLPQELELSLCPTPAYASCGLPNFNESYFKTPLVAPPCPDSIAFSFTEACAGESVLFEDLSFSHPDTIAWWFWNFGDPPAGAANLSFEKSPSHFYDFPGTYTVRLITSTDSLGRCNLDTLEQTLTILPCLSNDAPTRAPWTAKVGTHPADGTIGIWVSSNVSTPLHIRVIDLAGRVIYEQDAPILGNQTLTLGHTWPAGTYFVELSSGEKTEVHKAVSLMR